MKRRGISLGGMISSIMKAQQAKINGKIQTIPNHYIIEDHGWVNRGGVYIKPRDTADGRLASLRPGPCATNCPMQPGDFPIFDHGGPAYVPMKACRKCPNHVPRRRGKPYPTCIALRMLSSGNPTPAEVAQEMLKSAMQSATAILEGKR